jgi:hypothetical protein
MDSKYYSVVRRPFIIQIVSKPQPGQVPLLQNDLHGASKCAYSSNHAMYERPTCLVIWPGRPAVHTCDLLPVVALGCCPSVKALLVRIVAAGRLAPHQRLSTLLHATGGSEEQHC